MDYWCDILWIADRQTPFLVLRRVPILFARKDWNRKQKECCQTKSVKGWNRIAITRVKIRTYQASRSRKLSLQSTNLIRPLFKITLERPLLVDASGDVWRVKFVALANIIVWSWEPRKYGRVRRKDGWRGLLADQRTRQVAKKLGVGFRQASWGVERQVLQGLHQPKNNQRGVPNEVPRTWVKWTFKAL